MGVTVAGCPECAGGGSRRHRYCEGCGTNLWLRRDSTTTAAAPAASCPGCGEPASGPGADHCDACGLLRPDGTDRIELDLGVLAGVSDRGHVHPRNEDALAMGLHTDGSHTAAVVCDGISRGHRPERAARRAADAALDELLADDTRAGPDRVRRAVTAATRAVVGLPRPAAEAPASCTLVCALVERTGVVTVGWVGDSRAYWLGGRGSPDRTRLLTADHSWAARQLASGAPAEVVARHPLAHAVTRWVGPDTGGEPDVVTLRPSGPGALLLCTDGLWNYRPDPDDLAATVLPVTDGPLAAATALTTLALDAGGRDNVTVAVLPFGGEIDTERSAS